MMAKIWHFHALDEKEAERRWKESLDRCAFGYEKYDNGRNYVFFFETRDAARSFKQLTEKIYGKRKSVTSNPRIIEKDGLHMIDMNIDKWKIEEADKDGFAVTVDRWAAEQRQSDKMKWLSAPSDEEINTQTLKRGSSLRNLQH